MADGRWKTEIAGNPNIPKSTFRKIRYEKKKG
jgi:hypothetical protein